MDSKSLKISQLPSKFRSYDVKSVCTRGLFYHEAKSLAKYINGTDLEGLAHLYKDVITGIDVLDLEVVDFSVLMIISSIWTVEGFSWNPPIVCSHLVDGKVCKGDKLYSPVVLDDFEFDVDDLPMYRRVELELGDSSDWYYYPKRVRDQIKYQSLIQDIDPDDKDFYLLASYINNDTRDASYEDRLKAIKYAYSQQILDLNKIHDDMMIKNKPLIKQCGKCGGEVKLRLNLNQLRRFP